MSNEERVQEIQNGANVRSNMEQLYADNLLLIRKIANKYHGFADIDDLVQQGYLALVDAVKAFDVARGVQFSTFFHIVYEQNINEYLALTGQCVRVPLQTRHELKIYHQLIGKGLSLGEIAEKMEISYKRVQELAALDSGAVSLYSKLGEDGESVLIDQLAAPEEENKPDLSEIWSVLGDALDDKRAQIIYDLYREGVSMREEAEKLGISHQAIEQHQQKAFYRLRQIRKIRSLAEMADVNMLACCGVGVFKRTHTSAVERAVIYRERIRREEEKCHNEWLFEFEQKRKQFYEKYGINQ